MKNPNGQGRAGRRQGPVQLEHIYAIEKRLWNTAETLRSNSNYASNEYFMPVMGPIFLRTDFQRHCEAIVADYNREMDRLTIEKTFEDLLRFMQELGEEALAVFDLLKKPDLDAAEIKSVKAVAVELLGGGGRGPVRKRIPPCLLGLPHAAVAVLRGANLKRLGKFRRTKSIGSIPSVSPFGKGGQGDFETDFPGCRIPSGMTGLFRGE